MSSNESQEQKSIVKAISQGLQYFLMLFSFPALDPSLATEKNRPKWQRLGVAILTIVGIISVTIYIIMLCKGID